MRVNHRFKLDFKQSYNIYTHICKRPKPPNDCFNYFITPKKADSDIILHWTHGFRAKNLENLGFHGCRMPDIRVFFSSVLAIISEPTAEADSKSTSFVQIAKYALCCKAADSVDSSMKFQKFLQRFAVFLAQRLQTQRFLQSSCTEDLKYAFGNDRTQQKRLETHAALRKDTTMTSKAIATMNSV